jgi:ubiquinone/menaquinone biosynthesis C-methylase UbiE
MSDVSPLAFVEAVLAYQKTAAIKAAVDLDLFTAIGFGADTVAALVARLGASARGLRILCDFLTVHGFIEKSGDRYSLSPSTRTFLARNSPNYLGSIVDFHAAPEMCALFLRDPASYVRNGGSVGLGSVAPSHPIWQLFAESMQAIMTPIAQRVAKEVASWSKPPTRVLDIAAGHGMFGISIAKAVPGVELAAVDWPEILTIARRNAEKEGVAARFRGIEGDAFEVEWGGGFDLVLLANFLHHFDRDTCVGLLTKVRNSLAVEGKTLALEFIPNPDRVSPPFEASFAFYMLGSTPNGDAFTIEDLDAMARAAGFRGATAKLLPHSPQSLVVFDG